MEKQQSPFQRIVRSTAWLGASELAGRLLGLAAVVHLSRALQPSGMGIFDFGFAVFSVASLVTAGAEVRASRRAARSEQNLARLGGTHLLASWVSFAAIFAIIAAAAPWLPVPAEQRYAAVLFALPALLGPLGGRFAFLGREQMAPVALSTMVAQLVFLGLCLEFVSEPSDALRTPWIWMACEAVRVSLLYVGFQRRYGRIRISIRPSRLRTWIASSFPLGLSRLSRGLLLTLDLLLLGILTTPAQVGIYGVALRFPQFLSGIALLFHVAVFPAIARENVRGDFTRLQSMQRDALRAALGASLPAVATLSLAARPVVLLLFGAAYEASVPLLQILAWKVPLLAVGGLYRNVVLAREPRLEPRISALGLTVAGLCMLVLIPQLGGKGAALGILLGEATLLVSFALAARRLGGAAEGIIDRGSAIRIVLVLGALVGVSSLVDSQPPWLELATLVCCGAVGVAVTLAPFALRLLGELRRPGA